METDNMKMAVGIVDDAPPLSADVVSGTRWMSHRAVSHTLVHTQFRRSVTQQCRLAQSSRPLEERHDKQNYKQDRKTWLFWSHKESEIDSTKDLTFSCRSEATTSRHVEVIMLQKMEFWCHTCQVWTAVSHWLSRNAEIHLHFDVVCFLAWVKAFIFPRKVASDLSSVVFVPLKSSSRHFAWECFRLASFYKGKRKMVIVDSVQRAKVNA